MTGKNVTISPEQSFEIDFDANQHAIAAALPTGISIEKFKRVALIAVAATPDLLAADRRSLINSCIKCASDGLVPDGREAALVIYNTKVKDGAGKEHWEKRVQYLPMIGGVRKRMRNSGEVTSAEAHLVYEGDDFDFELGDDARIVHRPATLGNRGNVIGAYAIIKLANGEVIREVMSVAEIERARAASRAKDSGPWVTWWGEMARKTVLRRAAKAAPFSAELAGVLSRDDELERDEAVPIPPRPTRAAISPPPKTDEEIEQEAADGNAELDAKFAATTANTATEAKSSSGEPRLIEVPTDADGAHQWGEWGQAFAAALRGAETTMAVDGWMQVNCVPLMHLAEASPKYHDRIKNIAAERIAELAGQ